MKVIVFGATGSVGKHVLEQALQQGHEVTAFARDISKIGTQHPKLTKAEGNVLERAAIDQAMPGQDAVIVVLGAGRHGGVRATGTRLVIESMRAHGVERLICQSTIGLGDSAEYLNFFWRVLMFGWLLKEAFLDHQQQEEIVKNSGLDWTLVRPGEFTNGGLTGHYRHGFSGPVEDLKLKISRADVADFLIKQLSDQEYWYKTPGLSY